MSTATLSSPEVSSTLTVYGLPAQRPSAAEAAALARDGYVILRGVLDEAWRMQLAARLDELVVAEGDRAGLEVHQENGTDRLANLVDKGTVFDALWTHPRLLGLVHEVLGRPFNLSSLNTREPKPGQGQQKLHADWGALAPDEPFHVANCLWVLDGMDPTNGATRLVPGSHRTIGPIADPHPEQIVATLAPGDALFMNAHTRHGGTINTSGRRRRVIHSYFTAAGNPQQTDFPKLVSAATCARLSPGQRALLRLPE